MWMGRSVSSQALKSFFVAISLSALVLVQAGPLLAHTDYDIDAGAVIFKYPFGGRTYGMGRTGVADVGDPSDLFYNPAILATARGVLLTASKNQTYVNHEANWLINGGISAGYQGTSDSSVRIGFGGDVRLGRIDYGPIRWTDGMWATNTSEGSENYVGLSAAGGVLISDVVHVGLGATFKYWWADFAPDIPEVDGGVKTVAFDFGLRATANLFQESGFLLAPAIGVSYANLGPDVDLYDFALQETVSHALPRALRYGLSVRLETGSDPMTDGIRIHEPPLVGLTANFDVTDAQLYDRSEVYGGGLELAVMRMIFLRAGYVKDEDDDINDATFGFGLGLATTKFQARADYARVPVGGDRKGLNRYGVFVGILF
jgi:hypothetical protein